MKKIFIYFTLSFCLSNIYAQDCNENFYTKFVQDADKANQENNYEYAVNQYISALTVCPEKAQEVQLKIKDVFRKIELLKKRAEANKHKAEKALKESEISKKRAEIALKDAETSKKYAEKALEDAERSQKEKKMADRHTLIALKQAKKSAEIADLNAKLAQKNLEKANKLITAFHFAYDRFAVAYGEKKIRQNQATGEMAYYFIDKEGNHVQKLKSWDKIEQFNEFLNITKVQKGVKADKKLFFLDTLGNTYQIADSIENNPKNITAIDLSENYLDTISDKIFEHSWEILLLKQNKLSTISPQIGKLTELKILELGYNQLQNLPSQIKNLTKVKDLYVYGNQLQEIPDEIGNLQALIKLNLGYNKLIKIPSTIGQLSQLKSLELYGNQIITIPSAIGNLSNLTYLSLFNNQLNSLPSEIGNLKNLENLQIYQNQITSLPNTIGQLTQLKQFMLYGNQLSELPSEMGNLSNLDLLYIHELKLKTLPESFGKLDSLTVLSASNNQFTEFPLPITQMEKLNTLYIGGHSISSLPKEIGNLKNAEYLYLDYLKLLELPAEIGQLNKLKFLDLTQSLLTSLPPETGNLQNLQTLNLSGNPITEEEQTKIKALLPNCDIQFTQIDNAILIASLLLQKKFPQALEKQKQITQTRRNTTNLELLLSLYIVNKKPKKAIETALEALKLDPNFHEIEINLAWSYLLDNQWEKAEEIFLKWKGKSFESELVNDIVRDDLGELAEYDITHPDLEKVRKLFQK